MPKIPSKKQIKHKRLLLSIASAGVVFAVFFFYLIITQSGHWLVQDDEFDHANWVVVLDGQSADMERSDYAAELMASGKVDSVVILGRRILRNRNKAEFYLEDFLRQGEFDSNAVFIAPHDDPSTIGEAYTIIPWLKKHKADTVLLLTNAPSTYRVKRIFTKLSGESPVYVTKDINHYCYHADSWYSNRESRKDWLRGWAALFASYIDLLPAEILTEGDSVYHKPILSAAQKEAAENPVVDLQSLLPKAMATEPVTDSTLINAADSTKVSKDSSELSAAK